MSQDAELVGHQQKERSGSDDADAVGASSDALAASKSEDSVRAEGAERSGVADGNGGETVFDFDILSPACPSRTVLRHVVDRWIPLVVTVLADGPSRFGELRSRIGGVTPKVLTQTLRSMERDGLVTRTQLPGVPPRVDYELTDLGRSLQAPIGALRTWIQDNSAQILAHRESYDAIGS